MCACVRVHTHTQGWGRSREGCLQTRSDETTKTQVKRTKTLRNLWRGKSKE